MSRPLSICAFIVVVAFQVVNVQCQLEGLPSCARSCFEMTLSVAPAIGCEATDIKCICGLPTILDSAASCASSLCVAASDRATVTRLLKEACGDSSGTTSSSSSSPSSLDINDLAASISSDVNGILNSILSNNPVFSTRTPNLLTSAGTSMPTTRSTTATSSSPTDNSASNSVVPQTQGLSTGVKAGIGVGATVGVVIIALLIYIALLLRKRRSQPDVPPIVENEQLGIPELEPGVKPALAVVGARTVEELDGNEEKPNWGHEGRGRGASELQG